MKLRHSLLLCLLPMITSTYADNVLSACNNTTKCTSATEIDNLCKGQQCWTSPGYPAYNIQCDSSTNNQNYLLTNVIGGPYGMIETTPEGSGQDRYHQPSDAISALCNDKNHFLFPQSVPWPPASSNRE